MKYSNIGGQAVMEGVMMRNGEHYAVAVRTVDGKIAVEKKEHHALIRNEKIQNLPIIRGIVNFVDSLVLGMSSLMLSAEFFAEESVEETKERLAEEEKKTNKKAEKLRAAGKDARKGVESPVRAVPDIFRVSRRLHGDHPFSGKLPLRKPLKVVADKRSAR